MSVRLGINFWQAPWVALRHPERLERELDLLAEVGVRDLRILAGGEGPDDASGRVTPALRPAPDRWNDEIFAGLERTLRALEARDLSAILVLGNFWSWSGGLTQLRDWAGHGPIPTPPDGDAFRTHAAGFYADDAARALFAAHVEAVVTRLRGAGAVGAWEILNEPRGLHDPEGMRAFLDATAATIAALDPSTAVATGSEGSTADPADAGLDFRADHESPHVGLSTCHLWPENWELWDPTDPEADLEPILDWSRAYLRRHATIAGELGKPLLFEELGLARDNRRMGQGSTEARDRFFAAMLEEASALAAEGLPVRSVCFWTWSGEALGGAAPYPGDPPHEPEGWYGIGPSDRSTLDLFRAHSR
jgi:mannan endo-1,4-beta-mannosidase